MSESIRSFAESSLVEAKGDRSRAAEILSERLKASPELYAKVTEPFFSRAVWQEISVAASSMRMDFWNHGAPQGDASGLAAMAKRNASILDEWFLSCGIPLGDASKDDLAKEAAMHERFAASNADRAKFYRSIMTKMGKKRTVREAMSAAVVEAIKGEIHHE